MRAHSIVKRLNVGKNGVLSLESCSKPTVMHQFALEAAEEIFSNSVVVRVAFAGHALADAKCLQPLAIGRGSVLGASVTVEDESRFGALALHGHLQRSQGQACINTCREGITNNLFETEIFHNGKIQPAFVRGHIGDVAHPCLIGLCKFEVSL